LVQKDTTRGKEESEVQKDTVVPRKLWGSSTVEVRLRKTSWLHNNTRGGQHQIQGQTSFPKTVICTVVPLWIMCNYASMQYIEKHVGNDDFDG